ncbi:MAG: rhodanese-like domain-containing protein [Parasphingorhabdus sp.]|uniref:rhodanese-like domain-containing protein n=1 Tax=Parasphingorhabdus sp. TaxID=2709688 RepID=UPI0032992A31
MKHKGKIALFLTLCCPALLAGYVVLRSDSSDLVKVHNGIVQQFETVAHIDGDRLSAFAAEDIILFDVRKKSEYSVSHLENAVRVDPDISRAEFDEKFSALVKGKTAIFYCSVGQRSSRLADRTQDILLSSGARSAYNLEGGIFKWHNENRPLFAEKGQTTRFVHPYNAAWGRLVSNQEYTKY